MALTAGTIQEVQRTGHDTANGGFFDPTNGNMAADGAATSATGSSPVFTSASYNFTASDVGAWLFIKSGTNWIPGWYPIVSVSANAATLNAAVGSVVLRSFVLNTTAGCATTGSPTTATWSVDYSQQSSPRTTLTAATAAGAGSTLTDSTIGKNWVGNALVVTGGTNVTTGYYLIQSTSGTTATLDRAVTTGATTTAAGGMGGAFLSPGKAASIMVAGNQMWVKSGSTSSDYLITSASNNVAGGCASVPARSGTLPSMVRGYGTRRGDYGTRPTLKASGSISTFKVITIGAFDVMEHLDIDCNNYTASTGMDLSSRAFAYSCIVRNATANGAATIGGPTRSTVFGCYFTGCSGQPVPSGNCYYSTFYNNSATAIASGDAVVGNLVINTTGASSDGIQYSGDGMCVENTVYGSGRDNYRVTNVVCLFADNLSWGGVNGFNNVSGMTSSPLFFRCAAGGASTANFASNIAAGQKIDCITLSADPFTNAAGLDFSPNSAVGGGAAIRALAFPLSYLGTNTSNNRDIGAIQSRANGGYSRNGRGTVGK